MKTSLFWFCIILNLKQVWRFAFQKKWMRMVAAAQQCRCPVFKRQCLQQGCTRQTAEV